MFHFLSLDSDPRFPPFLLYVRWKSGVTFERRCFRDEFHAQLTQLSMKKLYNPGTRSDSKQPVKLESLARCLEFQI